MTDHSTNPLSGASRADHHKAPEQRSLLEIGTAHRIAIAALLSACVWGGVLWVML